MPKATAIAVQLLCRDEFLETIPRWVWKIGSGIGSYQIRDLWYKLLEFQIIVAEPSKLTCFWNQTMVVLLIRHIDFIEELALLMIAWIQWFEMNQCERILYWIYFQFTKNRRCIWNLPLTVSVITTTNKKAKIVRGIW